MAVLVNGLGYLHTCADTTHNFCAVDLGFEHESFGVYEQMSLTAFDLLTTVVTAFLSTHACGLDRLGIHYARTGLRISLQSDSQSFSDSLG